MKNQRDLLGDFYFNHQDEFESITEYVDDGHTGTDANREDFQQLLYRCDERENKLCDRQRPFPFRKKLQRCWQSD